MKKLLYIVVLIAAFQYHAGAQCIIYACDKTGAFGAAYNNDNAPTSMQECTDIAIKECKSKGGKECTFLYKSTKAGWWAFISGHTNDGRIYFQGGDGYTTQAAAENAVRNKYREGGGQEASTIKVYTWYAYANTK